MLLLPRRRRGRGYESDERRFLTRQQLAGLLAEVPDGWRPFFDLLASTGLRISEAIALRIVDVDLDSPQPRVHVRRAIVDGQRTGPKSRHGRRSIPIGAALAAQLRPISAERREADLLFVGAQGATLRPGNLRYRVMIPAAERAGVPWARFHTLRHTCAALLIDAGVGRCDCSAGWGTTPQPSRSTTTATSSTTASARRWISATGSPGWDL